MANSRGLLPAHRSWRYTSGGYPPVSRRSGAQHWERQVTKYPPHRRIHFITSGHTNKGECTNSSLITYTDPFRTPGDDNFVELHIGTVLWSDHGHTGPTTKAAPPPFVPAKFPPPSLRQTSPHNKQPRSPPRASSPTSRLIQQACGAPSNVEPTPAPKKAPPPIPTDDDEPTPAPPAQVNVVAQTIASGRKAPPPQPSQQRLNYRNNRRQQHSRTTIQGTTGATTSATPSSRYTPLPRA